MASVAAALDVAAVAVAADAAAADVAVVDAAATQDGTRAMPVGLVPTCLRHLEFPPAPLHRNRPAPPPSPSPIGLLRRFIHIHPLSSAASTFSAAHTQRQPVFPYVLCARVLVKGCSPCCPTNTNSIIKNSRRPLSPLRSLSAAARL